MTRTPLVIASLGLAAAAMAERIVREVDWSGIAAQGRLTEGVVVPGHAASGRGSLRLENAADQSRTFALLCLESPALRSPHFALEGEVRHEGVVGEAYLEMWVEFPDGDKFFSKTLAPSGPQGVMSGSTEWRPFRVPFDSSGAQAAPAKLSLNVVMPGRGVVELSPVKLVELSGGRAGGWWSARSAGWVGGIAGSIIGILGAVVGILAGRGRARRFVTAALAVLGAVGAASLVAGVIAILIGQPYAVYYPLSLLGVVLLVCGIGVRRSVMRRYQALEMRTLASKDASLA